MQKNLLKNRILLLFFTILIPLYSVADESTIATLLELKKSQEILTEEIRAKTILENNSTTDSEKERLKQEISVLDWHFNTIHMKFEKIATGIDVSAIRFNRGKQSSDIADDFQLLIKPLVHLAKEATKEMREKVELQEEVKHYQSILTQAKEAYENIVALSSEPNS